LTLQVHLTTICIAFTYYPQRLASQSQTNQYHTL